MPFSDPTVPVDAVRPAAPPPAPREAIGADPLAEYHVATPPALSRAARLHCLWETHAAALYRHVSTHVLEWPSLTLDWLPNRRYADAARDYALHSLAIGTQARAGERHSVRVLEVAVPHPSGGRALGGAAGMRFANVRGNCALRAEMSADAAVLRVRAMPQDDGLLAAQTSSGAVTLHHVDAPRVRTALRGQRTGGFALAWSAARAGDLASGADDGRVCVWDVRASVGSRPLRQIPAHGAAVADVAWHAAQPLLLSAGADAARLWDTRVGGRAVGVVDVEIDVGVGVGVWAAQWHPAAAFAFATGGADGAVRLWDTRRLSRPVGAWRFHAGGVTGVRWAPFQGAVFASCGDDGRVVVWDLAKRALPPAYAADGAAPAEVAFVHLGHIGRVTDAAWCGSHEEEWLMASTDTRNGLHVYAPKLDVVMDYVLPES